MSDHQSPSPELIVRNFLGVKQADITFTGINLISGRNGAGKSSLLEAAGCAIRQVPWARGMRTKKSGAAILRHGAERGSVSLSRGTARVMIAYPDAEITQLGMPVAAVTMLASGQGSFLGLFLDDRIREIQSRLNAIPTRDDVYAFLLEHEGGRPMQAVRTDIERRRTMLDDATDALMDRVTSSGWDAVHKAAREEATRMKGRWEQTAGQKFGEKKAASWMPNQLIPGKQYDLRAQGVLIQEAEIALEAMLVAKGVVEEEERALRDLASQIPALEAQEAALQAQANEIDRNMEAVVASMNAADAPLDKNTLFRCLKCGTYHRHVRVSTGRSAESIGNGLVLEIVQLPSSQEEEAQAKAAQAQEDALSGMRSAHRRITEQRLVLRKDIKACKDAATKLNQSVGQPVRNEEAVAEQRGKIIELRMIADAINQHEVGTTIFRDYFQQKAIVDCLAPEGVRQIVLVRKMEAFRGELAHISSLAGFEAVSMADDLSITYGGRPEELLSRSERWRVDLALAVALAVHEGNQMLIVDELDLLDPESRPGVLQMLKRMEMNALVGMTARDTGQVPSLKKFGLGRSWWMKEGAMQEIVA